MAKALLKLLLGGVSKEQFDRVCGDVVGDYWCGNTLKSLIKREYEHLEEDLG